MKTKQSILFFLIGALLIFANSCKKPDSNKNQTPKTVTDIDGNVYHTVTIGTQVWMVENLKTTHYRDGAPISKIDGGWDTSGIYSDYANQSSNSDTYGRLYSWPAVNNSHYICPKGWHVASDDDWTTLTTYLGGKSIAGDKLKETGTSHWNHPNTGTNETGFTALPGGYVGRNGASYGMGIYGYWWTSTPNGTDAWYRSIFDSSVQDGLDPPNFYCLSVRCVMDK